MKKITTAVFIFLISSMFVGCGVDKSNQTAVPDNKGPIMEGAWELALLPFSGDCQSLGKGIAMYGPFKIDVNQTGDALSGKINLGGVDYSMSGNIVYGNMIIKFVNPGLFIETLAAKAKVPVFEGSFNGQELPDGCTESGFFIGATRDLEFPPVTGEWIITLTGTASDCDDPLDEGLFEKIIQNVVVVSPKEGSITAAYQDPTGVLNTLIGSAIEDKLIAAISDIAAPPNRAAILRGKIKSATLIEGRLSGELAFAGGVCSVNGAFVVDY